MQQVKLERIRSWIKEEITTILKVTSNNPLFKTITITDVKITKDHSYATIYWMMYNKEININDVSNGLEKANSFCRTNLAKTSTLYKVPELRFKYDESENRAQNITDILNKIKDKD